MTKTPHCDFTITPPNFYRKTKEGVENMKMNALNYFKNYKISSIKNLKTIIFLNNFNTENTILLNTCVYIIVDKYYMKSSMFQVYVPCNIKKKVWSHMNSYMH